VAERVLVAVAVVVIAATEVGYMLLIRAQGGPPSDTPWVVPFVAGYLVLMAALLAASTLVPATARVALRGGASAGLLVLGVLAAFSIGLAVLIAAALALASAVVARPRGREVLSAFGGGVIAVALLLAGFQLSWSHVVCPATGQSGGSTADCLAAAPTPATRES